MTLITFEMAKDQLGETTTDRDRLIQMWIDQATDMIIQAISKPADETRTALIAGWDLDGSPQGVPPPSIQAAVLELMTELSMFRGDDLQAPARGDRNQFTPTIEAKILPWRRLILA